ncbi:MAG: hypothetical protein ACW99U_11060 [Candidatus Thorarchaeota archaeon]
MMRKRGAKEKKIRQALDKLREKNLEERLRLRGIDIEKIRSMEQETNEELDKLVTQFRELRLIDVEKVAARHEKYIEMGPSVLLPPTRIPLSFCLCLPIHDADYVWHPAEDEGIELPPQCSDVLPCTGVEVSGPYDEALMQAQPYVSVSGRGSGTGSLDNKATISRQFYFTFDPKEINPNAVDGTWCIDPEVYMSGWWLMWLNDCECGPGGDPLNGMVQVLLRVQVDQVSRTKAFREHTVLLNTSSDPNDEGVIDYISKQDGGAYVTAYLEADHEVVISVECEVSVEVKGCGRAFVDMAAGRNLYFRVPRVGVGQQICSGCPPSPMIICPPNPAVLCPPNPGLCPPMPNIICPPMPERILCPPMPDDIICPPAPIDCLAGPDPLPFRPGMIERKKSRRKK